MAETNFKYNFDEKTYTFPPCDVETYLIANEIAENKSKNAHDLYSLALKIAQNNLQNENLNDIINKITMDELELFVLLYFRNLYEVRHSKNF